MIMGLFNNEIKAIILELIQFLGFWVLKMK